MTGVRHEERSSCAVFKRTYASANAVLDARFAEANLGWTSQYQQTYTDKAGATCAERELLVALGEFGIHLFTSDVTPQDDNYPVTDWVAFWSYLHANLSDPNFAWDAMLNVRKKDRLIEKELQKLRLGIGGFLGPNRKNKLS